LSVRIQSTALDVEDRVHERSLIAVVKLGSLCIAGQAHGSLRGRLFGRLNMALDRFSRPRWCSRLPNELGTSTRGIAHDCAIVLTGRSGKIQQVTRRFRSCDLFCFLRGPAEWLRGYPHGMRDHGEFPRYGNFGFTKTTTSRNAQALTLQGRELRNACQ